MISQESERLEARAKELDVSVASLRSCKHPESLIYFDKVYGAQCSWEICEVCGTEHDFTELSPPDHLTTDSMSYHDSHGYHYYASA